MRIQLVISAGAIIAMLVMVTPALAQGVCGIPGGYGFGGPVGCGFGAPFGGFGPGPLGGGFGLPFGIGGCGFGDPFTGIVGLGMAMIESVIGTAFSCIPLGLGGFGFGGCGIPFGGCGFY
jgi:hypothetical protein